jgi:hypothetical protein
MKRLEVSGEVRPIEGSLGVKGLKAIYVVFCEYWDLILQIRYITFQQFQTQH